MREMLLIFTIILGQIAPNAHLLTKITNRLRPVPVLDIDKSSIAQPETIITEPTRLRAEDYTAAAKSVYSIDLKSNSTLTSKNINARLPIASLTKLMTAYVILKEEQYIDSIMKVSSLDLQPGDSTMGLVVGDTLSVRYLLDGLLITSGSDAAITLAINNADSEEAFVEKMNTAATNLKLTNTHFSNPVGWDDTENYSSARDMTELVRILLRNKTFVEISSTKNKNIIISGRNIFLETTNILLYTPGFSGIKTGYTPGAGECLISLYAEGEAQILTTVIGSGARFPETEAIKGWILEHFSW
jgi:D-alanyl-D-alanine carboxypeptidase (penicillin-binding protein 5/6)